MRMRTARNVAIIMLLALLVAFAPNGGNFVDAILTAISLAFLAAICWMLYVLSREKQLTLATLTDGRRAILYGALGVLALCVAGADKLFRTGGGTVLWIAMLAGAVFAIWRVWTEANTY